jgi:hypothetical protein
MENELKQRLTKAMIDFEKDPQKAVEGLGKLLAGFKKVRAINPVQKRNEMDNWYTSYHRAYELKDENDKPAGAYLYHKSEWCTGCNCGYYGELVELRFLSREQFKQFFECSVDYDHNIARNLSIMNLPSAKVRLVANKLRSKKGYSEVEYGCHSKELDYNLSRGLIEHLEDYDFKNGGAGI